MITPCLLAKLWFCRVRQYTLMPLWANFKGRGQKSAAFYCFHIVTGKQDREKQSIRYLFNGTIHAVKRV